MALDDLNDEHEIEDGRAREMEEDEASYEERPFGRQLSVPQEFFDMAHDYFKYRRD